MNLEKTLSDFQNDLSRQGMSPNTIASYLTAVRQFYAHSTVLTVETLQDFRKQLMEHYRPSTVNARISAINRYLSFIHAQKEDAPPSILPPLPKAAPLPDSYRLYAVRMQQKSYLDSIISQEDYEHLKASLLSDNNMSWYFLIHFLGSTGVRVGELIQIKVEHLHLGYMDLYSKGGKVRRIYFPDRLCKEALPWYTSQGRKSGFLFTNKSGKPLTPRWIHSYLKVLAVRYGVDPRTVYPHSFRHRFAKNFLKKFNDISLLADLMGHESIETTRIYLTHSTSEQRQTIDQIVTW